MRSLFALLVSALISLMCCVALAQDTADEAELHFRIAARRYEANDFEGALEHFFASNRLSPNKNVVYNIARCYEQLKQPGDAYRWYALSLEGSSDAAFVKRAQESIARMRPLVGLVRVETNPPGATLYLDRKELGPRGVAPRLLAVTPGKYTVLAELQGFELGKSEPLDVRAGSDHAVRLELAPIMGRVKVEVEPDAHGAAVRIDREDAVPMCAAPCEIPVPTGRHKLLVSKPGFQAAEVELEVPASGVATARPRLVAQYGTLVVGADVREALISIDGKPGGFTPAVLTVPVGEHEVKVTAAGFLPHTSRVTVRNGQQVRIEADMAVSDEVAAASKSTQQTGDAPASVTVITRQELRAMGYPTIAEAVRGVRGLYLSDDRQYETVGFRGFARPGDYGNRVLVTLDGHAVNDDYLGSSYVGFDARVDLDDIDRIEVIRGPGSALYGTGAFFGVINLVTRSRQDRTHAELAAGTAGDGVGRARATGFVRLGEGAGAWTSVSLARGAGRDFFFPEFQSDPATGGHARGMDGFDAGTIGGRAFYKALTVQWFFTERVKRVPTAAFGAQFGDPRFYVKDTRAFVEAKFEPQVGKSVELLARAYGNFYDYNDQTPYPADPIAMTPALLDRVSFKGRWIGSELRFTFKDDAKLRLSAGLDGTFHFMTHQREVEDTGRVVFDRNDPYAQLAPYALGDYAPVPQLRLHAGARLDYFSNLQRFDPGAAFSPRLAVILKPTPRDNVKILGGKAFRAPSVYELYARGAGQAASENLQPEQVFSGEIEYAHRFTDTLTAAVAGYTSYVSNLIELIPAPSDPTLSQYANTTSVLVAGGEAELRREWKQGFMFGASASVQKASYIDDPRLCTSSFRCRDVPNSPVALGSVKGAAPILGRSLMLMTRVSVESPRPDGFNLVSDPRQQWTETGVIWDLVLSGELEKLSARYAIGFYNIADWRYDAVPTREYAQRTLPQRGRSLLATVEVKF